MKRKQRFTVGILGLIPLSVVVLGSLQFVDNGFAQEVQVRAERRYIKPDNKIVRQSLSALQFRVTQQDGTEPAFENAYWDNKKSGIYVDIVSGEPLFSSTDKFRSGTGWPSFVRPLEAGNIVERKDQKFFMSRTEVRSRVAGSHLGHVFLDGPKPTGLRYCINSAALRFIDKDSLVKEGYPQYVGLFR